MPPHITWTRRAEERLATALRRTNGPTRALAVELAGISQRLSAAFRHAADVIVLNYFVGFKHRANEHILQIDVRQPGASQTFVVKLADHERLSRERDAWASCKITDTNPVFMPLHAFVEADAPDQLLAIAYQDAQQHIGAEETVWLESAVQRCVRFNSPSLGSILDMLNDIYTQFGRLYSNSGRLETHASTAIQTVPTRNNPDERHILAHSLARWDESGPRSIRRQTTAAFSVGFTQFIDPVDYYRFLDAELAARIQNVVPDLHRGLAHGDLHGRNALVGIDEREHATFAALFDYECINADNLIGWDFVEMETELKIRIYERIFTPANLADHARQVQRFEWELAEATRHCHETKRWPPRHVEGQTPRDRLLAVLLAIREKAYYTLGRMRAESIDWLREYLFLLGCYGLTTVRYDNQNEFERTAAFVSAGVASAYLERLHGPRDDRNDRHPTYQTPLAVARKGSRSKNTNDLQQAAQLLAGLVQMYPTAQHVWFEQAFNLTKQDRISDALRLLKKIHADFCGRLDEDTLSLWGRCYKDRGDRHLEIGLRSADSSPEQLSAFEEAEQEYRHAIDQYTKAYAEAGGFFPGINVATLTFLRAGLSARLGWSETARSLREESQRKAEEILNRPQWQELQPDDAVWRRATRAEAAMLCGKFDHAAERYRVALEQPECEPHHPESVGKQLRRIIEGYRLLNEAVPLERFKQLALLWPYIQPENS